MASLSVYGGIIMSVKQIIWIVIITIAMVIVGVLMNDFADRKAVENADQRQVDGITMSYSDRVYKYSPSGIRYFIECIEGREFISGRSGHSAFVAGPINDKEC